DSFGIRGSITSCALARIPVERRALPVPKFGPRSSIPLCRSPRLGWLPENTPGTWDGAVGDTSGLPTRTLAITLPRGFGAAGCCSLGFIVASGAEHRRVSLLEHLAVAEVHVDPARQAGIEAADRPHDVDPLEVVAAVLLEDRQPLHRVLVGA